MNLEKELPNEKNLRKTSRDLLRAYKYVLNHPEEKLISTSRLGKVLGLQGRALGGVLAGAGKVSHTPILIRQGVVKTSWSGKYKSREQLWSRNPKIPNDVRNRLKKILDEMHLDIFQIRCPGCESVGAERIRRGVGAIGDKQSLPGNTYKCCSCQRIFSERDLEQ